MWTVWYVVNEELEEKVYRVSKDWYRTRAVALVVGQV